MPNYFPTSKKFSEKAAKYLREITDALSQAENELNKRGK